MTDSSAVVRWQLEWGADGVAVSTRPTRLIFDGWMKVRKDSQTMRLVEIGWTAHELEPGAEAEFWKHSKNKSMKQIIEAPWHGLSDWFSALNPKQQAAADRW